MNPSNQSKDIIMQTTSLTPLQNRSQAIKVYLQNPTSRNKQLVVSANNELNKITSK